MDKYDGLATFLYVASGVWFVAFAVGVVIDRRRLRNGVYLVIALGFLGVSALLKLSIASPETAGALVVPLLLVSPVLTFGLAVFLILNGMLVLRREGWRLANLLSLLLGMGILGFMGFAAFAVTVHAPVVRAAIGAVAGVLCYFAFVFGCFLLYSVLYARIGHRGGADFVVVLGAGLNGDEVPAQLAGRLDRAREVADSLAVPTIIVSGGQGPGAERSEARAMADYLVEKGVPEDRILLEEESRTTLQNLRFSREIMVARKPDYRCVVVTSNYHVLRAAVFTRRAGVTGHVVGAPIAAYFWPSAFLREFVAILVDNKVKNGALCVLFALLGALALKN
ncbi:YdcF family protein [Allokutzneria oryzae]|uniref:YdcF family protein n=1 Tax=Allokutzneria oryzae TaxID=1378989 RepID=A0ABV6A468_9PSEU